MEFRGVVFNERKWRHYFDDLESDNGAETGQKCPQARTGDRMGCVVGWEIYPAKIAG